MVFDIPSLHLSCLIYIRTIRAKRNQHFIWYRDYSVITQNHTKMQKMNWKFNSNKTWCSDSYKIQNQVTDTCNESGGFFTYVNLRRPSESSRRYKSSDRCYTITRLKKTCKTTVISKPILLDKSHELPIKYNISYTTPKPIFWH